MIFLLKASLLMASTAAVLAAADAADVSKLAWMTGCHVLETPRVKIEEQWMKPEGGLMMGINRTVRRGKAVAHEYLKIDVNKEGAVVYTALIGTKNETPFKMTSQGDTEIVFENPDHDFPKRISYKKTPDGFLARIDGGPKAPEKHQDFPMKSVPCVR
jgi:hypothetical protein